MKSSAENKAVANKKPGRPKGQPNKLTRDIKERAAFYGDKALQTIVTLMGSADERVALDASKTLLERAYGKPTQHNEHSGPGGAAIPVKAEVAFVSSPARGS